MSIFVTDFVGVAGVLVVLLAYFLLQAELLRFDDYSYLALNATGSLMIIVSLVFKFNPASFLIESCWVAISMYGFYRRWWRDKQEQ